METAATGGDRMAVRRCDLRLGTSRVVRDKTLAAKGRLTPLWLTS